MYTPEDWMKWKNKCRIVWSIKKAGFHLHAQTGETTFERGSNIRFHEPDQKVTLVAKKKKFNFHDVKQSTLTWSPEML